MNARAVDRGERIHKLHQEIRADWERLWISKYDDTVMAEGISRNDFQRLFVLQGEVIMANRDFKQLIFREILEKHMSTEEVERYFPDRNIGGWKKFVKKQLPKKPNHKRERPKIKKDPIQQKRKNGCGWLNQRRNRTRKIG